MDNTVKQYNGLSKALHWLSALTVFGLFGVGYWMVDLTYYSEWYKTAPHWHKSIGLLLAFATVFRLVWKKMKPQPEIEGKPYEVMAAKLAHALLYLLLFGLFISGYMISTADGRGIEVFDWFTIPGFGSLVENQEDIAGEVHYYLAYTVMGLSLLHALAALKHHFINKDDTLKKMIGVKG